MPSPDALRERFLATFFAAWPERDMPEERIRASLRLDIESGDEGSAMVVCALGSTSSYGFVPGDSMEDLADEMARHLAENAEGDR